MKLINQSHEILTDIDALRVYASLERAIRTAYKSEGMIKAGSAEKIIRKVLHSFKHESVIEHESISVRIITNRGVSHELVRHRLASYTQESTRYCNYSKDKFNEEITYIEPVWTDIKKDLHAHGQFEKSLENAERGYLKLLKAGWSPEQAREVLPNAVKTELVMTANLREWRHFFKLRTAPEAHPQMRALAKEMLQEMFKLLPVIFEDLVDV